MKIATRLAAGFLVVAATMGGIYAVSATAATSMAATFEVTETTSHNDRTSFAAAVKERSTAKLARGL